MKNTIKIGIADDHKIVREGYIALLKDAENIEILFDVSNGAELIDALGKTFVDIVLLDLQMPVMNGMVALQIIKKDFPSTKIIVLSHFAEKAIILDYIRQGVNSFLEKNCGFEVLVQAITSVYLNGSYYDQRISSILAEAVRISPDGKIIKPARSLTDAQLKIISFVCKQITNKEMAEMLSLSIRTIEWHRVQIMEKTGSKDLSALIAYAIEHNLVNKE